MAFTSRNVRIKTSICAYAVTSVCISCVCSAFVCCIGRPTNLAVFAVHDLPLHQEHARVEGLLFRLQCPRAVELAFQFAHQRVARRLLDASHNVMFVRLKIARVFWTRRNIDVHHARARMQRKTQTQTTTHLQSVDGVGRITALLELCLNSLVAPTPLNGFWWHLNLL